MEVTSQNSDPEQSATIAHPAASWLSGGAALFSQTGGSTSRALTPAAKRHLDDADGWLGLGDHVEAAEELGRIAPRLQTHPEVLHLRCRVYVAAEKWKMAVEMAHVIAKFVPGNSYGFVKLACGLHELKRTKEARGVLLSIVERFPDDYLIRYNLACYECQLGNLTEAHGWLLKARNLAGGEEIRFQALSDPDLEPMWSEISRILTRDNPSALYS